jgi:hypothetical protein
MKVTLNTEGTRKQVIKKCHVCGCLNESNREVEKCSSCQKPFLPMNYFGKVHAKNSAEFKQLFANASELHEEDMIKGLTVIW